jgi:hypothetical protein
LKEISDHDLEGIKRHPDWEVLEYADHPLTTTDRQWYNGETECDTSARALKPGRACHEFPYFSTSEGGPAGGANFGAYLELLDYNKNRYQGILLSAFYRRCHIPQGDTFYVRGGPLTWGVCKQPR